LFTFVISKEIISEPFWQVLPSTWGRTGIWFGWWSARRRVGQFAFPRTTYHTLSFLSM